MKIAITGHRPPRLKGQEKEIKAWIIKQFEELQPSVIYDGMASGTDLIAATAAKELNIPIVCCYAYPKDKYGETEQWILENNQKVTVSDSYSKKAYFYRDAYMVDHADVVLTVWDGVAAGGAYITREYAKKKNKTVIDYKGLISEGSN